ncbi:MAG: hypothetical protein ABIQ88_07995 [Chitinophagaceae bacterium]
MFANADLVVSAWGGHKLVGISRSISDWVWCSYLADLAVAPPYKKSGIGKKYWRLPGKSQAGSQWSCCCPFQPPWIITPKLVLQKKTAASSLTGLISYHTKIKPVLN